MIKITAQKIFVGNGDVYEDKVLLLHKDGRVIGIEPTSEHEHTTIRHLDGYIIPGMINAHCHLELSHMKGKVDTGTGLIPFITNVVQHRDIPQEQIDDAIRAGDREMYDSGIVAVGDICNQLDTKKIKDKSEIDYYSFVEMFDFLDDNDTAQATFDSYKAVYEGQSRAGNNKVSAVPHAPYSVSPGLFRLINTLNGPKDTVSIHNQEMVAENLLFENKTGELLDFYQSFGMSLDGFAALGVPSIAYALDHMDHKCKTIFVHNTLTNSDNMRLAHQHMDMVYWATCPNANLYIENKLPDYAAFQSQGAKMTIGTDSLTSNWQLSVWEEIKTLRKYKSYLPLSELVQWATLHGAEALGYEDRLGSFEEGKCPGVVHISGVDIESGDVGASVAKRVL